MEKYGPASDSVMTTFIQSKGFQNWMKCVTAQNETRKALCEVVEVKWKGYISQMTDEEKGHIETILECLKCAEIETLEVGQNLPCDHPLCASILQKLFQLWKHQPDLNNDEASSIPSSDSCYHQFWHIAKLYICAKDVIATKAGLKGLDLSVLSGMMNNCQLFAFDDSVNTYNAIREDRVELFMSSDNHITDEKRGIMLEHISNLLSHFCGARLKMCEDVIGDIQQMETTDWLSEYQQEYKQLARENLERKIAALKLDTSLSDNQKLHDSLKATEILLQQLNESMSEDESEDQRELQAEIDSLKEEVMLLEMEKEEIEYRRTIVMEENRFLQVKLIELQFEASEETAKRTIVMEENRFLQDKLNALQIEAFEERKQKYAVTKENKFLESNLNLVTLERNAVMEENRYLKDKLTKL